MRQVEAGTLKSSLRKVAESSAVAARESSSSVPVSEEEHLRALLWTNMIARRLAEKELSRIEGSPLFQIENVLVRKPWSFAMRALKWLIRRF